MKENQTDTPQYDSYLLAKGAAEKYHKLNLHNSITIMTSMSFGILEAAATLPIKAVPFTFLASCVMLARLAITRYKAAKLKQTFNHAIKHIPQEDINALEPLTNAINEESIISAEKLNPAKHPVRTASYGIAAGLTAIWPLTGMLVTSAILLDQENDQTADIKKKATLTTLMLNKP